MSWQEYVRVHPTMGVWYERYRRRPSWVTRGALLAGALVIVVPLVVLTVAAVVIGMGVFFVLSALAWVAGLFSGVGATQRTPGDDGRQNVRVIQR